ncbi:hypothetical protein GH714_034495 [Hevea brasiliensis]|uniref:Uncharacterized protein n=1 Tax=Hevea brasiliensis TaxID=3981 RepID=A0A6A6N732_HEVBR|nr:hypothetical protein GH714_034495 [Hevea brasiliensis]
MFVKESIMYWPSSLNEIEMLVKVKGMRTLFFERVPDTKIKEGLNMITSKFEKLRALDLIDVYCRVPNSIAKLKYLRYLGISNIDFVVAWDKGSSRAVLNEVNGLNQLRGRIVLRNLEKVENVELQSKQVNLREKTPSVFGVMLGKASFSFGCG